MWTMLFNYVGSKALSLSNFNHFKALNLFSFHVAWNAFVKWAYLRTPLSLYRNAKSKCENLMFKVVKKVESVSNWLTFVWIIYRLILTAMSRPARNSVLAYQSTNRPTDRHDIRFYFGHFWGDTHQWVRLLQYWHFSL